MDHVHTVHRSPKTEGLDESLFTDDESECNYSDMERLVLAEERICSRGQKRINSVREDVEQHGSERKKQKPMAKKQAVVDNRHITGRGRPAAVSKTGVVPGSSLLQAGKKAVGALSGFVHGALEVLRTLAAYVGPRLSTFTWSLSWNRPKTPSFSRTPPSSSIPAESEGVMWTSDRSQQPQTASLSSRDSLPGSVSTPPTLASRCLPPTIPMSPATSFRLAVTCELQAEDNGQIVFQKTDNSVVYRTYDQMQKQMGQFRFSSGCGQRSFKVLSDDLPTLIKEMHDATFAGYSLSESIQMPEPRMSCSAVPLVGSEVGKRAESLMHVDASTQVDRGNSGSASPPALSGGNVYVLDDAGTAYEPVEEELEEPQEETGLLEADIDPGIRLESGTKRKVQFDEEESGGEGGADGPVMQDILSGIQGSGDDSRTTFTFSDEDTEPEIPVQQESTADDANTFQSDETMPQSSQSSMYPSDIPSCQGTITSVESSIAGSNGFPDDGATFSASQGSGRPRKRLRIGPATPSRIHYPRAAKERGEATRLRLIPPRRVRAPVRNRGRRQLSEPPVSPPPAPFRTISSPMSASQPS